MVFFLIFPSPTYLSKIKDQPYQKNTWTGPLNISPKKDIAYISHIPYFRRVCIGFFQFIP